MRKATSKSKPEPREQTVYNPIYRQGAQQIPAPSTDNQDRINRCPVKMSKKQREREERERRAQLRRALKKHQPPDSSSSASSGSASACSSQSETSCAVPCVDIDPCVDIEVNDDERVYQRIEESGIMRDFHVDLNPKDGQARMVPSERLRSSQQQIYIQDETADESGPYDSWPSTDPRSDHSETDALIPASPTNTRSVNDENADDDCPIYDVGYGPGDSGELRPAKSHKRPTSSRRSKEEAVALIPASPRKVPPPLLPRPSREQIQKVKSCSGQQTTVKTVCESASHAPCPSSDHRSDHPVETDAPIPARSRNVSPANHENTNDDGPIYDVGYEPGDSGELPTPRSHKASARSCRSKDTGAHVPAVPRKAPPPALPPKPRAALRKPSTNPSQQTLFINPSQQTHVNTPVQSESQQPAVRTDHQSASQQQYWSTDTEPTDEQGPSHVTVQAEVHGSFHTSGSSCSGSLTGPTDPEEKPEPRQPTS